MSLNDFSPSEERWFKSLQMRKDWGYEKAAQRQPWLEQPQLWPFRSREGEQKFFSIPKRLGPSRYYKVSPVSETAIDAWRVKWRKQPFAPAWDWKKFGADPGWMEQQYWRNVGESWIAGRSMQDVRVGYPMEWWWDQGGRIKDRSFSSWLGSTTPRQTAFRAAKGRWISGWYERNLGIMPGMEETARGTLRIMPRDIPDKAMHRIMIEEGRPGRAWGVGAWTRGSVEDTATNYQRVLYGDRYPHIKDVGISPAEAVVKSRQYDLRRGTPRTRQDINYYRKAAADIRINFMTGKYKSLEESAAAWKAAKGWTAAEKAAGGALKTAGTAMFAFALLESGSRMMGHGAAGAASVRGRVGPEPELTAHPYKANALTRYKMYHPDHQAEGFRDTMELLSWVGGPAGRAIMGLSLTTADVLVAARRDRQDLETLGAIAHEGITTTARDIALMKAAGFMFGKIGQGYGWLKNRAIQRAASRAAGKVAYTAEQRALTWAADRGAMQSGFTPAVSRGAKPAVSMVSRKPAQSWFNTPFPGFEGAKGLRSWIASPKAAAATFMKGYGFSMTFTKLLSSPMTSPLGHAQRYMDAYRGTTMKNYVERRLLQTSFLEVMRQGFLAKPQAISLQDLDPGEIAQPAGFYAFPYLMDKYYTGRNVLREKYWSEAKAHGMQPASAADYALAAVNASVPMVGISAMGAADYFAYSLLGKIPGVGKLGGFLGKHGMEFASDIGKYYMTEGRMAGNILAFQYSSMPTRMAAFPGFISLGTGALTYAAAKRIPGMPEPAAKWAGKAAEAGMFWGFLNQSIKGRGVALSDPTYTKYLGKKDPVSAQFIAHTLGKFHKTRVGDLDKTARGKLNYFYSEYPTGGWRSNWMPANLAFRSVKSMTTIPHMYTQWRAGDMLLGDYAKPAAMKFLSEEMSQGMIGGWPFASAAAATSGKQSMDLAQMALSFRGSPFGGSVQENIRTYDVMREAGSQDWKRKFSFGRENYILVKTDAIEQLYSVEGENWWTSPKNLYAARVKGAKKWSITARDREERARAEGILNRVRDRHRAVLAEQGPLKLVKETDLFSPEEGPDTVAQMLLLEMDKTKSGMGYGYERKYRPDAIVVHPDSIHGTSPFGDSMLLAALADSVQEWNWRSPRRGGQPFTGEGDY